MTLNLLTLLSIEKKLAIKIILCDQKTFIFECDVLAKPGSKIEKNFVNARGELVIQTRARPVEGEANRAIVEILSLLFGLPKSSIEILRGDKSKNKRIKLMGEITAKKTYAYYETKFREIKSEF